MLVFIIMIRRPPRSTLFPYTRSSDLQAERRSGCRQSPVMKPTRQAEATMAICFLSEVPGNWNRSVADRVAVRPRGRSEEHTSELQSRRDLVCRLLLEKKKTKD